MTTLTYLLHISNKTWSLSTLKNVVYSGCKSSLTSSAYSVDTLVSYFTNHTLNVIYPHTRLYLLPPICCILISLVSPTFSFFSRWLPKQNYQKKTDSTTSLTFSFLSKDKLHEQGSNAIAISLQSPYSYNSLYTSLCWWNSSEFIPVTSESPNWLF